MDKAKQFYFYVLLCADNSLYGGFTTDIQRRVAMHNAGKGAKYTRTHRPVTLIYYEVFNDKSSALQAENAFKHQSRQCKITYLLQHHAPIRLNCTGRIEIITK